MQKILCPIIVLLSIIIVTISSLQAPCQNIKKHVSWKFSTKVISDSEIDLIFSGTAEKDWHFYTLKDELNPFTITFEKSKDFKVIGNASEWPAPKKEYDDLMAANRSYYEKSGSFTQRIKILSNKPFIAKGTIEYQACLLDGMCVMESPDFSFKIEPTTSAITDTTSNDSLAQSSADTAKTIIQPTDSSTVKVDTSVPGTTDSLWMLFIFSFLAGLAAILTPCVFPMIPMTVSFFMHNSDNKRKARFQALVYGFSIILIYTVIGTVVAITLGANFANFLSTHWLPNIFFFLIFVIFAASFFGMFEITLPSWMVNKADQKSEKGGILGSFFMAFTLVLVSFSCTGPIVGAILVKSAGGQLLEPIVGMFGFSLAFALPFATFAFFPSLLNSLPKSGGWLNAVKVVLGFLELALGLKFLSIADQTYHWGILDREVYLALWIVIFTLMGFYLLGKLKFAHDSELKHIGVPRLLMAIITFSFVIYMVPGMFGAPLKVLSGYMPPQTSLDFDMNRIVRENASLAGAASDETNLCEKPKYGDFLHLPHGLEGYFDYEQGLACAKKLNKPIFVDYTGHGCVNCREMEANVWSDPRVLKRLKEDYIVMALYVDDKTELPEKEWITSKYDGKLKTSIGKKNADLQISKYNVNAQPYYILLDTKGEILVSPRAYNLDIDAFIEFLDNGLAEFKKRSANK
jgi:thiol:disulfide interchange protein